MGVSLLLLNLGRGIELPKNHRKRAQILNSKSIRYNLSDL